MLGYSFTPGLANRFKTAANGPGQLGNNASQALQILSLHLPDQLQGHAPAPDDLLRGSGGLTPDTAVRAQTSGISAPASALPIATPAMASLTSAAIDPTTAFLSSMGGGGPFGGTAPDPGPSGNPPPGGHTSFQFPQLLGSGAGTGETPPTAGPVLPEMPGFNSFLDAILQGMR